MEQSERTFWTRLVRFEPNGKGTDVDPVPVKDWHLGLRETLDLFSVFAEKYPDAHSDANSIDSIEFTVPSGKKFSLYVAD